MRHHPILGLDLGSSKIAAVIGDISSRNEISVRGAGMVSAKGLAKGKIEDIYAYAKSIEQAIHRAETEAGVRPNRVIANLPTGSLSFQRSQGIILKTERGDITEKEYQDCIRHAREVVPKMHRKVVHVIPLEYRIDGRTVFYPVGLQGQSLEIDALNILCESETLRVISQVLNMFSLHINGLVYDSLSASMAYLTDTEKKDGALLIDIGGQFTKVNWFEGEGLSQAFWLPIGGDTFTSDLSICLKISVSEAEHLKKGMTAAGNRNSLESAVPILSTSETLFNQKKLISQILEARAKELANMIQKQLPKNIAPKKTILAGQGAKIEIITAFFSAFFGKPIQTDCLPSFHLPHENPAFSSALSLILFGIKSKAVTGASTSVHASTNLFNAIKGWFRRGV